MTITVSNAQRTVPVSTTRMHRLARRAVRALGIRARGQLDVTFIDTRRMRRLNARFMRHDWPTDVLSFRYDPAQRPRRVKPAGLPAPRGAQRAGRQAGQALVGEILIAPGQARSYARRHGIAYQEELSRYVVHGLLHWMGKDDTTARQQAQMRRCEDRVLARCTARTR